MSGVLRACLWRDNAGRALPAGGGTLMSVDVYQGYLLESESVKWFSIPADEPSLSFPLASQMRVTVFCGFICRVGNVLVGRTSCYICGFWCAFKAS